MEPAEISLRVWRMAADNSAVGESPNWLAESLCMP